VRLSAVVVHDGVASGLLLSDVTVAISLR